MGPECEFTLEHVKNVLVVMPGSRVGTLAGGEIAERRRHLIEVVRHSEFRTTVVDLRNVEYLNSCLLDTLCVVWGCLRERSAKMVLCNLSDVAQDVFNVSRLNRLWPVYSSREEALDAQALICDASGADIAAESQSAARH